MVSGILNNRRFYLNKCSKSKTGNISFSGQSDVTRKYTDNDIFVPSNPFFLKSVPDRPLGNFWQVGTNFYRGAQPGIDENDGGKIVYQKLLEDLKWLRDKKNVSSIMNLRNPNDHHTKHIELEKQAVNQLNAESPDKKIELLNVPMHSEKGLFAPDAKNIFEFFSAADEKHSGNANSAYWHCRSGNDRTGIVGALHRIWSNEKAGFDNICKEMLTLGHNNRWYPNLQSSLAACLTYMATANKPEYDNLKNSKGIKGFIKDFYLKNKESMDRRNIWLVRK